MTFPGTATECVRRGATMLDAMDPYWHERLSVGVLDIASDRHCVLGQLYGHFTRGVLALFGTLYADSDYHGFSAFSAKDGGWGDVDEYQAWDDLRHAWRDEITRRRLCATSRVAPPYFTDAVAGRPIDHGVLVSA